MLVKTPTRANGKLKKVSSLKNTNEGRALRSRPFAVVGVVTNNFNASDNELENCEFLVGDNNMGRENICLAIPAGEDYCYANISTCW